MSRIWRVLLMAVALCVGTAVMAGTAMAEQSGAPTAGRAGERDASFGKGGKVRTGFGGPSSAIARYLP